MSGSCRETTETEKKKNTKYLFKMFHSEHLHCEFQYQILSHCAAKHLMEKTETQRGNLHMYKMLKHKLCFLFKQTFWIISWMSAFGKVMFSPSSREEMIWRSRRKQDADGDGL